ncbi:glycoside hydrolase [Novosphingobium sp. TH158]|nr:glycosyltransferase [Novosphingobium sp. TH158]PLK25653.1 glycoside hydrolase [Novosphingobium sp. TH158]
MRVLSLSTLFPSAARPGFGLFVARQFDALAARGDIELALVCPVARPVWPLSLLRRLPAGALALPADRNPPFPVHYVPFAYVPGISARWNPALLARAVLPLARRLHAERPFDVIDAQFFYPEGPAAARVAHALGLPLSITARGSDIHLWGKAASARPQILSAGQQAAGMRAVSAALRADMIDLGLPGDRIEVYHTGLDHTRFKPVPRREARQQVAADAELAIPCEGPLLVAVGNLIPLKGQALVIEALAAIPQARLVLAGQGPERANFASLASRLGLEERVQFAGSVPAGKLATLLSAADVMVLPSEREGLANAWVEAIACGTPIVIPDVGGAREVVTGPDAGRLAQRTPAAIAEAVRELLANPPSQATVAAHAARFSWEVNAAGLSAHYRRIARP